MPEATISCECGPCSPRLGKQWTGTGFLYFQHAGCVSTHTHTHSFRAFHGEQVENTPRGNWRNTKTTTMTTTSSTAISEYYYGMGFFKFYEKGHMCCLVCHVSSTPTFCIGNREAEKKWPSPSCLFLGPGTHGVPRDFCLQSARQILGSCRNQDSGPLGV